MFMKLPISAASQLGCMPSCALPAAGVPAADLAASAALPGHAHSAHPSFTDPKGCCAGPWLQRPPAEACWVVERPPFACL